MHYRSQKVEFIKNICPQPDHFCDGTFIKDREIKQDNLKPCKHYDACTGCRHPKYPLKYDERETKD
jgi:hypothetical protein